MATATTARPAAHGVTPMWVGVDDTDGPEGGCTTHVLTEIVRVAHDLGLDVLGEPRLVRLNPNVPWKTRGNAALSVRLGIGTGSRRQIGRLRGRPVWGYRAGREPARSRRREVVDRLWRAVLNASDGDPAADPALVVGTGRLPGGLYRRAVRSVVPLPEVEALLRHRRFDVRCRGSRRGLVGAAAAIAWPGRRATWELLAYRNPARVGTRRRVDAASVRSVARAYPSLFLCHDPATRRLLVAPHTRCPILYGLRSVDRAVLSRAAARVRSEPVDRWLTFRTNQGTGDHVRASLVRGGEAFSSGRLHGTVVSPPSDGRGGHVRFELVATDGTRVTCLAFEPTKTLPRVARDLRLGDQLQVWGGRGADPVLRVEGIVLGHRRAERVPGPRPRCERCDRTARSLGRARGFRCPGCGGRFPPEARGVALRRPRYGPGTYHPTPSARRHLAPLGPGAFFGR